MGKRIIQNRNIWRIVALFAESIVIGITIYATRVDTPAFVWNGVPFYLWFLIFAVGTIVVFLVAIVPTLGEAAKTVIEIIKAWRNRGAQ